jgi:hypothetical protein
VLSSKPFAANSFPCHTSTISPVTPLFATHPKTPSRKPFTCRTYNPPPREVSSCLTIANHIRPGRFRKSARHSPLPPLFSTTYALFCTRAKANSFLFNALRTLCQKHLGGRGWGPFSIFHFLCPSKSYCPRCASVQEWRLLSTFGLGKGPGNVLETSPPLAVSNQGERTFVLGVRKADMGFGKRSTPDPG